jgi:hypothetical protein
LVAKFCRFDIIYISLSNLLGGGRYSNKVFFEKFSGKHFGEGNFSKCKLEG